MEQFDIFDFLPDGDKYKPIKSTDWKWTMANDYPKEKNGLKVFSCFACGGGSTMGYKLAGCDVIGCEVWWKEGVTGENPLHYEFLHETAQPKLKSWGVECNFVRSKITAYDFMTTPIKYSKTHPDRIGKLRGFPLCSKCGIQRDCKKRPCERFYKEQKEPYTVIIGIANDEKDRILSNTANNRHSLLEILSVDEHQTYGIVAQENLLSPTYSFSDRGGCWFCANQKIWELELLYYNFPHLWGELMEIQKLPNKVQENFTRTKTLYDIEKEILNGVQMKLFRGDLMKGGNT